MERVPKSVFTKEFKEEAVKMVTEGQLTIPEIGRRLSIPKLTLAHWVKIAKEGTLNTNRKQRPVIGEEMELTRLKRETTNPWYLSGHNPCHHLRRWSLTME
ncbi:MAG: transposase [Proteobacteria bacterium]|nr:transposase [Pseudomonadota bacterium]